MIVDSKVKRTLDMMKLTKITVSFFRVTNMQVRYALNFSTLKVFLYYRMLLV